MKARNDGTTPNWVLHALALLITLFALLLTRSGARDSVEMTALLQIVPPDGYVLESGVVEIDILAEGRPSEVRNLAQPRGTLTLQRSALVADGSEPQPVVTRNILTSTADFSALRDVRVEVLSETVPVRAWRLVERELPIEPQFVDEPPSGWEVQQAEVAPQSVRVMVREVDLSDEGDALALRTMPVDWPGPVELDADEPRHRFVRRVGIELERYMRFVDGGRDVTVSFVLQRRQEMRDFGNIPIELVGAAADDARLNIRSASVRLRGATAAVGDFDGNGLAIRVDLAQFSDEEGRVAVELKADAVTNVPDDLEVVRVQPQEIYLTLPERPSSSEEETPQP